MSSDSELLALLAKEEQVRLLRQWQQEAEERGDIPRTPFLFLRKGSILLQILAGVLWGAVIGAACVFSIFIIGVRVFHLF